VCRGAGHQDDQLSTDRQVALRRGLLEVARRPKDVIDDQYLNDIICAESS
jgi:hypothetical protein